MILAIVVLVLVGVAAVFVAIGRRDPDRAARIAAFRKSEGWAQSERAEKKGQETLKTIGITIPIAIILLAISWSIPSLAKATGILGPAGSGMIVASLAFFIAFRLRRRFAPKGRHDGNGT